jgi:uncharacterized protein
VEAGRVPHAVVRSVDAPRRAGNLLRHEGVPAASGVIVADTDADQRSASADPRAAVLRYVALAFAITWVVWIPRAAASRGLFDNDVVLDLGAVWTYGPALAAVVAAAWTGGRPSLRELGARVVRWRVGWGWYAVVVLVPLALAGTTLAIGSLFGGDAGISMPDGGVAMLVVLALALTLTDGLGEEVGWRGWALPRLLEQHDVLRASLLLGLVWAAWHLPLHLTEGSYLADVPVWVLFARLPATSIVYTWVFLHTRGSALLAVLLHGVMNVAAGLLPTGVVWDVAGVVTHWSAALALIVVAGATLDRWPGRRQPAGAQR